MIVNGIFQPFLTIITGSDPVIVNGIFQPFLAIYKTGVKHSMISKQLKDDHGITVMESFTGPQHVYACLSAIDPSNEISIISGRTNILYHGTVVCKSHVASA